MSLNKKIIQNLSELPYPESIKTLYMDFETTSFEDKIPAFFPYNGHRIAGIAITWDSHAFSYYIPIRHTGLGVYQNLPIQPVIEWLKHIIKSTELWVNHNVKFDANFLVVEGVPITCQLFCTVVGAKLIDSDLDFKGANYQLDTLSKLWLNKDISHFEKSIKETLARYGKYAKNYGLIPIEMMGDYACEDVLTNRSLYLYLLYKRPVGVIPTWNMEKKLTPVLLDMEHRGLRVDKEQLKFKSAYLNGELCDILYEIKDATGSIFNPRSNGDCYDLLINHFGLPILSYTSAEKEDIIDHSDTNPSFDKHALELYLSHHDVIIDDNKFKVVSLIKKYRDRAILLNNFVDKFIEMQDDKGFLHPSYNQLVRTGRMSCKNPSTQQQTTESKSLILPDDDNSAFLSEDASQIEFRLMIDFIGDKNVIDAYRDNPDTDFHQWVADEVGVKRKQGKTLNFMIGYGAGKKKILTKLETDEDIVKAILERLKIELASGTITEKQSTEFFKAMGARKANEIYVKYHDTLPGIKTITKVAENKVKNTGFVTSPLGRNRQLPPKAAFRAFNSIIQGWASDVIKAGMIKFAPRYCSYTRNLGVDVRINVHDEITFHGPKEVLMDEHFVANTTINLEESLVPLRIPLRFGAGYGDKNWGQTSYENKVKGEEKYSYDKVGYGARLVDRSKNNLTISHTLKDYKD